MMLEFISCEYQNTNNSADQSDNSVAQSEQETNQQQKKGLADQFPGDENIEDHPAVLFASGFEDGFEGWSQFNENVSEIIENKAAAHSGSKILQTTATKRENTGGDVIFRLPEGVDELYLRFYTKFHRDTVVPHHFVKIRAFKPDSYWGNAARNPKVMKHFGRELSHQKNTHGSFTHTGTK